MYHWTMLASTLLLILTSQVATAQDTKLETTEKSQQLRFVAQLVANGCPVFVHDTGAKDGRHLAVEPLMCVMESIDSEPPRYDYLSMTTYLSVRVTVKDNSVLAEVEHQLRYLAPKSVKFANVSQVSVSDIEYPHFASLGVGVLGFDWTPGDSVGVLRINYKLKDCPAYDLVSFRSRQFEVLKGVVLTATINTHGEDRKLDYRPTAQNETLLDAAVLGQTHLPDCQNYLRFVRSIRFKSCTAQVNERLDKPGHFLIEPLLCLDTSRVSNLSLTRDDTCCKTGTSYMKLDVALQDDTMADIVKTKLAYLSPRSVAFMKLWRASVAWTSNSTFAYSIGPLVVSTDGRSAQVRLYCHDQQNCKFLSQALLRGPDKLFEDLDWTVEFRVDDQCVHAPVTVSSNAHFETKLKMAKLRFVAQLKVNGCPLIVHDTGATDGLHLAIEPLMCVTQDLEKVKQIMYDAKSGESYFTVRLLVRDDAMLSEVQSQLRHLSPKSVKFAPISNITISIDDSKMNYNAELKWAAEDSYALLNLIVSRYGSVDTLLSSRFQKNPFDALRRIELTSNIISNGKLAQIKNRPSVQSGTDVDVSSWGDTFLPRCQLQFIRSMDLNNCSARVHERLDNKGHFLIEPLLCRSGSSFSDRIVRLNIQLQNDRVLELAKKKLADHSVRSVTFMRLWRVKPVQSDLDSRELWVSSVMMSNSGELAQLQIECLYNYNFCYTKLQMIGDNPHLLLRHIKWQVTSRVDSSCALRSIRTFQSGADIDSFYQSDIEKRWSGSCNIAATAATLLPDTCQFSMSKDGRKFLTIQQWKAGNVSLQRNWAEFENGFGDESDFWLGLKAIHSLSKNGVTFRVEIRQLNGFQIYAEFAGFRVDDGGTNYTMNYTRALMNSSNTMADPLTELKESQFSIINTDTDDNAKMRCSEGHGWWFPRVLCTELFRNRRSDIKKANFFRDTVMEARLMLEI